MPQSEQVVDRGDGARVPAAQHAPTHQVSAFVGSGETGASLSHASNGAHSGDCSPFNLAVRVCKLGVGDDHTGESSDDGHHVSELIPREEGRGNRRGE
eukprot:scaffold104486_cov69-Phaeocystis_antarctica.AAC.2